MSLFGQKAYVGIWTNYSKGTVLGATLTIPAQHGNILVAVLALLVGWTGSHFWGLSCFIFHQLRSTSRDKDGLHHQQQAILRSRMSDTTILYRLLEIGSAWKSHTKTPFLRILPLVLAAIINIAVFLVAGAFSSRVTSIDSEVLARGKCGLLGNMTYIKPFSEWTPSDWQTGDVLFTSANIGYRQQSSYVRSCYGDYLEKGDTQCNLFTTPFIASSRNIAAPCPFSGDICSSPAIALDTGYINSDKTFGINSHAKDQIEMRKTLSCAVIPVENFSTDWTSEQKPGLEEYFTFVVPNDTYKYYSLGRSMRTGLPISDYTWVASNASIGLESQPYNLEYQSFYPNNLNASWFVPIDELSHDDADITLLLLNKKVGFTGQVFDPWFSATVQGPSEIGIDQVFFSDDTYSGVGCVEQYQFCNGAKCSPMNGLYTFDPKAPPDLAYNSIQTATYSLILKFATFGRLDIMLMSLKNEVILAGELVYGPFGISTALEDTHWHIEIENLHNISLAGLQANQVSHASAGHLPVRPGVDYQDFVQPETTPENIQLCNNQKFRSTAYSSFNVLGLSLILAVSFMIIMLNLSLPQIVGRIQRTRGKSQIARLSWIEDDVLQLQRLALEGKGVGPWKGKTDSVPVIEHFGVNVTQAPYAASFDDLQLSEIFQHLNSHESRES